MKHSLKNHSLKVSLFALLALSACDYAAKPYPKAGTPENLIDASSETVSVGLSDFDAVSRLEAMIRDDQPSSAELRCSTKDKKCAKAKKILEKNAVPVTMSLERTNKLVLSYDRVVARDCDNRYVDNMSGSRSYNHPAFGCSVASNALQMVSDKRQFTNPPLLDFPDAEKGNESYQGYLQPSSKRDVKAAEWSTGSSAK